MSHFDWLSGYLDALKAAHVLVSQGSTHKLAPARLLTINAEDWGNAARIAATQGLRWAGLWGDAIGTGTNTDTHADKNAAIMVYACLVSQGDYLLLSTRVPQCSPLLPSHTPYFAAADRLERHAQDLLGLAFSDHPDSRHWTRHQAWDENEYPLRTGFPAAGSPPDITPADSGYPFRQAKGAGVYEIPVGPVHAGIIEPGHFRFQAVGEEVLNLEQHLGYVHKGIEKIAVGRDPEGLARLAARVSGDSAVAHGWAACQAMERASGAQPSPRAEDLRALLAERERVANHLGDIGAICNDVGFGFAMSQCSRLREQWQRRNAELFGHRLLMDCVVPGGIAIDLDEAGIALLRADHATLRRHSGALFDLLDDQPSLDDRLLTTGHLSQASAVALGCSGYVAKASGVSIDVRHDSPYGSYRRLPVDTVTEQDGDVAARVRVRMREIKASLSWMERLLESLGDGPLRVPLPAIITHDATGIGIIDGWRGEIISFARLGADGRVLRYFPRDPSWHAWPALERIQCGNIVPDFPVCNKSVNGSYSGQDL